MVYDSEWDNEFQQMIAEGILDRPDGTDPIVMTDEEADRAEAEMAMALGWCPFSGLTPTEWLASRDTLAAA